MKSIAKLILLVFFSCSMINGQNSDKILLIDETREFSEKETKIEVDKTAQQVIDGAIKKDAARFWQANANCALQSRILGLSEGFFVSKNEKQLAVLYSLCNGLQGLIILNQRKVAAHYGFKNEADVKISKLEDIDKNGFDEILIQSMHFNQRALFHKHRIVELSPNGLQELFYYQTYKEEFNAIKDTMDGSASKIYVEKAAKPIFYEEQFSDSKGQWTNNGQSIRYNSGWKQTKEMTALENLPEAEIVEYFEITKSKN